MILSTLEKRNAGPLDDFWYRPAHLSRDMGKEASPEEAMGLSAWYNAVQILSSSLGFIPCHLYRRLADGGRERVVGDPRGRLVSQRANPWMGSKVWREMGQGHVVTRGNHYSRIVRDRMDRATQLVPLHPDRVQLRTDTGEILYHINGGNEKLTQREMLHVRGPGDGLVGWSVVEIARRSLGYALQLEQHGSELMGNKARPGGVLSTEQVLKPETREALARQWDGMFTGGGLGKTAVLDAGLGWQQVGFSAEDAQFLESRQFQIAEVSRWTNIPPHMLKELSRSTNNNIEHQGIEFVVHTMRPWAERWEEALNLALLEPEELDEYFFKFSLDALLRGDSEARGSFYKMLFEMGVLSPNEIRALEEMNPVDGGEQRFVQLNLVPLDKAGEGFAVAEPEAEPEEERALESRTAPVIETPDRTSVTERSYRIRNRLREVHRDLVTSAAARLVQREVQDIGRMIEASKGDPEDFLRRLEIFAADLPGTVRTIMGPMLAAYIELVADAAAEEVGMEELDGVRVSAWSSAYVDGLARGHTTETVGKLTDTIATGDEPFGSARTMLERWSENRAASMGLREVVTSAGGVATLVYSMAGFGAVWRTVGETCPYCKLLEGRTVGAGNAFINEGDMLDPGDGTEPMTVGRSIKHPQAHDGCDCTVSAWR